MSSLKSTSSSSSSKDVQVSDFSLLILSITLSTSVIEEYLSGDICAAQPVITIFLSGYSFLILLIVCLTCLSVSFVTAQEFITTIFSLLFTNNSSIFFPSKLFSRHPKLTTLDI